MSAALYTLLGPGSDAIRAADNKCNTNTNVIEINIPDKDFLTTGDDAKRFTCMHEWNTRCDAFCKQAAQTCKGAAVKCIRATPATCAYNVGTKRWESGKATCRCKCSDPAQAKCDCNCYYSWNCTADKREGVPPLWNQSYCQWNYGAKDNENFTGDPIHDQCKPENQTVCKCKLPKKTEAGSTQAEQKQNQCKLEYADRPKAERAKGPCDGLCTVAKNGSEFAFEDARAVADSFGLWAQAILDAAARGGGLADDALVHQAEERLNDEYLGSIMGRHVESLLLEMAGTELRFFHPDMQHGPHAHPVGDLSGNPCLLEGLRRLAAAQVAEIRSLGSGGAILDTIPGLCRGVLSHALPCGDDDTQQDMAPLDCLRLRIEGFAIYVTTIPNKLPDIPELPEPLPMTAFLESPAQSPGCPGACLLPQGFCAIVSESDCTAKGGGYMGDDSDCENFINLASLGACCFPGPPIADCLDGYEGPGCAFDGGTFFGPGSTCAALYDAGTCPLPPPGACCAPSGCVDGLFITQCQHIDGGLFTGILCDDLFQAGICNDGTPLSETVWEPTTHPEPWPNINPEATTRSLRFVVTGPPSPTNLAAIKVTMVDLQHPKPANLPAQAPPNYTTYDTKLNGVCNGGTLVGHHCDIDADCPPGVVVGRCAPLVACTADPACANPAACTLPSNSCARWVGKPGTFLEDQDSPLGAAYRGSRLQCTPSYQDWKAEGVITVAGAEIAPSSEYSVQVYGESCMGAEDGCTDVSAPVTMYTRRSGDVEQPLNPPSTSGQPDVTDIAQLVNKFKNLSGALVKAISQLQPNLPELNADINALDIVAVVDSVKGLKWAFSGPCACPSLVACGLTACPSGAAVCVTTYGAGSTCVKTCTGPGPLMGDSCINNTHCVGSGTCGAGFCRDRCGRCSP